MPSQVEHYLGNKNLKKAGVAVQWSGDRIQEYIKCSEDPIYFIKTYVKIVNIDKGLIPFHMWPFQEELVAKAVTDRFVIAKMPRQVGKCFSINTIVRVFDKKSGKIYNTTIGDLYELSKMQNLQSRNERSNFAHLSQTPDQSRTISSSISWSRNSVSDNSRFAVGQNFWRQESCLSTWWKIFTVFGEVCRSKRFKHSQESSRDSKQESEHNNNSRVLFEENRWGHRGSRNSSERSSDHVQSGKVYSEVWGSGRSSSVDGPSEEMGKQFQETKLFKNFANTFPQNYGNISIERSILCDVGYSINEEFCQQRVQTNSEQRKVGSSGLFGYSQEKNNRIRWDILAPRNSSKSRKRTPERFDDFRRWISNSSCERTRLQEESRYSHSELLKLSDVVERKFIDSVSLENLEIWTDTGWQPASTIHKTVEYIEWELVTSSHNLTCADTHIVFRKDGSEVYVKDLIPGDVILTESGPEEIMSVTETDRSSNMYDITVDSEDHRFYTNGILSHNTTTIGAVLLWYLLFHENFSMAILANKERQAREILSRIQNMFEHIPPWLQQGVVEWNKGNIELENGSKAIASSTSSSAIRGTSQNLIYLDEFAHVPNNLAEEFFASVYPTISSGQNSKVLITSTPNGMNMFHKIWKDSEDGRNRYTRVSVHWSMIPGRDEAWKAETIANTSERQFTVEYECEFLGSSNTLIDGKKLLTLAYSNPVFSSNNVDIYEHPVRGNKYIITADTARGVDEDYSACVVFDVTVVPYRIVAKFQANDIPILIYPTVILQLAKTFNEALILVEINDAGQQVADILHYDLEYEGVLVTQTKGRAGQKIGAGFAGKGSKPQFGVRTTTQVKRIGCANFKSLVENDKLIISDYDLIYEMARFVQVKDSYEAEEGEHDDLVMCCVLFSWLVNQTYFKELTDTDVRRNLIDDNKELLDSDTLPFGFLPGEDEDGFSTLGAYETKADSFHDMDFGPHREYF